MRTTIGIRTRAAPSEVFGLARDVERWPEMLPHYRSVSVEGAADGRVVARMVAVRRFGPVPVPVTWRAEQWAEGEDAEDLRLRFRHVWGVTRGMDVTWHIRPEGEGSHVTIEHRFDRRLPVLGDRFLPALVDRVFTRHIAARTLRTFARLAESRKTHPRSGSDTDERT